MHENDSKITSYTATKRILTQSPSLCVDLAALALFSGPFILEGRPHNGLAFLCVDRCMTGFTCCQILISKPLDLLTY